jgi:hypothetical protein
MDAVVKYPTENMLEAESSVRSVPRLNNEQPLLQERLPRYVVVFIISGNGAAICTQSYSAMQR